MNKKITQALVLSAIMLPLSTLSARAVCPVCTIAIAAGLGLSRWLGIDDLITGTWLGALLFAGLLWYNSTLVRKNKTAPQILIRDTVFLAITGVLVIWPLYYFKIIGDPLRKIWGMDKLLVGMIAGLMVFGLSLLVDKLLRWKRNGKSLFPYQKVIIPVTLLLIASYLLYCSPLCKVQIAG
ncbi:MAG: hypothetical protein NTX26_00775 [Candidatus Parcubacteria bacterium]|nr:hypothetical protein [Candidatus Parcubacteria bacterium]